MNLSAGALQVNYKYLYLKQVNISAEYYKRIENSSMRLEAYVRKSFRFVLTEFS